MSHCVLIYLVKCLVAISTEYMLDQPPNPKMCLSDLKFALSRYALNESIQFLFMILEKN